GSETLSAMLGMHDELVEASTPPIPPGDQRPDHHPARLREEERITIAGQQAGQTLGRIAHARWSLCYLPKVEHGRDVLLDGTAQQHRTRPALGDPLVADALPVLTERDATRITPP